jgi:hypothetical protein
MNAKLREDMTAEPRAGDWLVVMQQSGGFEQVHSYSTKKFVHTWEVN